MLLKPSGLVAPYKCNTFTFIIISRHDHDTWCQESKSKLAKVTHKSDKQKIAEQLMSKAITRAVAEATRIGMQTMAETQAQRTQNAVGPKLGGPTLKQPTFD